jgi:choline dehydrogenase-like flavoprotein
MGYDVAIYGSGFAGFSAARAALEDGLSVIVVEKGSRNDLTAAVINAGVASPWEPVQSGGFDFGVSDLSAFAHVPRFFGLGGTSMLWSGKWRPLDSVDFARRIGDRAWPFGPAELEPSVQAVSELFSVAIKPGLTAGPPLDRCCSAGLRIVPIRVETEPTRLTQLWARLEANPRLTIVTDVAKTRFHLADGRLVGVGLETPGGHRQDLEARYHVVAAGGIESARLVYQLASSVTGRTRTHLGGYMDHPKGEVGRLYSPSRNLDALDALLDPTDAGHMLTLGLPEQELLDNGLGNHTLFLWGRSRRQLGWKRLYSRREIRLVINVDQFPEETNQIDLSTQDTVRWRISGETRGNLDRFLDRILPRVEGLWGKIDRVSWCDLRGAGHPAGCTPFAHSPDAFQLHPDGRVACLGNAFCASSAAFPFAGSANPTLTIAALGHRIGAALSRLARR